MWHEPHEGGAETVFRDVILLALAGVVAMVVLMLPHLHPPGERSAADAEPPGNVVVEARWPDGLDADVDLWVRAPGDVPVGYSNKGGAIFNLLRDDLGNRADATGLNYEVAYARGLVPGEYAVNLHMFRNAAAVWPVPVTVVVSAKARAQDPLRQLLAARVRLIREGEELTVFRFRLDAAGRVVPGSVNSVPVQLRSAKVIGR